MSVALSTVAECASLARTLKRAWLAFWLVFFGNFAVWRLFGSDFILAGLTVLLASYAWLGWTTARAASASGHTGVVWGIGVFLLGPLGALLLPWAALSKLRGPSDG